MIEERALSSNTDYCYGDRVSYLDEDQFVTPGMDVYDRSMKLWKVLDSGLAPGEIDDGHGSVTALSNARSMMLDLINSHATATIQLAPGQVNGQVPKKYRDIQMWALPAGLPQVNQ